jgi:hypothetical protein
LKGSPDEPSDPDYDDQGNPLKTPSTRDPLDPDEKKFEQELNAAFSAPPSVERGPGRSYDPASKALGDRKAPSCCWQAMQYGTCSKQGCTFMHSPDAISEALAKMVALFPKPKNRVSVIMPTRKPPDQPGRPKIEGEPLPNQTIAKLSVSLNHVLSYAGKLDMIVNSVMLIASLL